MFIYKATLFKFQRLLLLQLSCNKQRLATFNIKIKTCAYFQVYQSIKTLNFRVCGKNSSEPQKSLKASERLKLLDVDIFSVLYPRRLHISSLTRSAVHLFLFVRLKWHVKYANYPFNPFKHRKTAYLQRSRIHCWICCSFFISRDCVSLGRFVFELKQRDVLMCLSDVSLSLD